MSCPDVIETHISVILLTGDYAYKFKKPVDLGFVDFTTLEKRRFYCEEELRLNRRLAPELYLDVVPVGGDPDRPRPGVEPAIEYCLKMRQFPQSAELDRLVAADKVAPESFARLAYEVAEFHDVAEAAGVDSSYGTPARVRQDCLDNFTAIDAGKIGMAMSADLQVLRDWTEQALDRLEPLIAERQRSGRVRECHGDMHLTNMVMLDGRIRCFDCLEFNADLRWVDVINEVAFLLMDLDDRRRPDLGRIFLNAYLEAGGDYAGLALLRLFKVYRSMVRAKVACLRAGQTGADGKAWQRFERHIRLARQYIDMSARPLLIIAHGLSGSGKTTLTDKLIPYGDVVRVRSDVERKRLAGLPTTARSQSALEQGLYATDLTWQTYQRLAQVARDIVGSGQSAIIDATFIKHEQRQRFQSLAASLDAGFMILNCTAPEKVLRSRVSARAVKGQDASEADITVLEHQLVAAESLTPEEQRTAVSVDTSEPIDARQLAARLGIESEVGSL